MAGITTRMRTLSLVYCLVKLIDFAHTRVAAGEGPDGGALLGMDTTLKLLGGRITQVKQS